MTDTTQLSFIDPNSIVYKLGSIMICTITIINILLVIFFLFSFLSGKLFHSQKKGNDKLPKEYQDSLIHRKGCFSNNSKLKIHDTCPICLTEYGNLNEVIELPICAHLYHCKCILGWLDDHSTCPYCRADIKENLEKEKNE